MEVKIKEEQVEECSEKLYSYNEAVKEELFYHNLSDVGPIKIEEHCIDSVTLEQDYEIRENSLEVAKVYYCYNCNFNCRTKPGLLLT